MWFLLLAVSLSLNMGLLYVRIADRHPPRFDRSDHADRRGPPHLIQDETPPPETVARDHLAAITRHLDLDTSQQSAVRMLLEEYMPGMGALQRDSREAGRHISDAFAAPDFDPERFRILAERASRARMRVDSMSTVMLIGEASVLTPEQRALFSEVAPTAFTGPRRIPPTPRP